MPEGDGMKQPLMSVKRCEDFDPTGRGDNAQWEKAEWVELVQRPGGQHDYRSRLKMLYSAEGIYVLFDGTDQVLSATITEDFADLWHEDVFECFFWPDEKSPVYFECEISPLGYELPILVPNFEGEQYGWRPWHYEGKRKTKKGIHIAGGEQKPHAPIDGWRAEVFIPYVLLKPLQNVPPRPGARWRANFYRVDYDGGEATGWDWARVGNSFHEIKKFGTIEFK